MKPMMALIATGVVLLLIMLYFGKTSFEGTFETNVYQNSVKYDKTAPIIKELEKLISGVSLENIDNSQTKINFKSDITSKYTDAVIKGIEITYPNKNNNVAANYNSEGNYYSLDQTLTPGLYTVIFYISITNESAPVKVFKSVFVE